MEVETLVADIEKRKEECLHQIKQRHDYHMYTLSDACRESGESYESIRRILRSDNPTVCSLERVARVLGVTLRWLLCGDVSRIEWRADNDGLY